MDLEEVLERKVQALVEAQTDDMEALEYDEEAMREEHLAAVEAKAWVKVELLATDRGLPGHNVGKMLLGAALQCSMMAARANLSDVGLHLLERDREGGMIPHLALRFGFQNEGSREVRCSTVVVLCPGKAAVL